ncbi:hypothetical protein CJF30_00000749 [Rutstroemia sp. NJR-2017a BBW]|nr:hypothetical protein CJF30_00000749 [Rutstroemia sp. NJR-2017a BBW]
MSNPTLAHRSVSNIRPTIGNTGSPTSPHTPLRSISSSFGSPSALRAEEESVVVEIGTRYLRAGFAGEAVPQAIVDFGPEEQRRAGDYRSWLPDYEKSWRARIGGKKWGEAHELWTADLRGADLGLVGDKIERAMRDAFTKYLLIDSRPRKVILALPSNLASPLLSIVLNTIFINFQSPSISLFSAPALTTVAAGLRAAMVVDIGWAETLVTGIYEYREVSSSRSVRATKLLGKEMQKTLAESFDPTILQHEQEEKREAALQEFMSFEECEEVVTRVAWCKPSAGSTPKRFSSDSPPADRESELESDMQNLNLSSDPDSIASIPLHSTNPPRTLHLPFSKLAEPCETALLASNIPEHELDDEELPIHLLLYRSLLRLPLDLRSVCMSRVIFVGGGSHVLGLKGRVMDEVQKLISERGWDPVQGRAVNQFKNNPRLKRNRARQVDEGPAGVEGGEVELSRAGFQDPEPDPIEAQIRREAEKGSKPPEQGTLRAVESLGAWAGASLLTQLRVPAVSTIEREVWLKEGIAGANKNADISVAVAAGTRGSMGPGAFNKGAGERISWTLGLWG